METRAFRVLKIVESMSLLKSERAICANAPQTRRIAEHEMWGELSQLANLVVKVHQVAGCRFLFVQGKDLHALFISLEH